MTLQSGRLAMAALGVDAYPTLWPGTHLRWWFDPTLGYPDFGFDVFRRAYRPGTPRFLDFAGSSTGSLGTPATLGPTTWVGSDFYRPNRFLTQTTSEGMKVVLQPSTLTTCHFDQSEVPIRRIELDVVHWGPRFSSQAAVPFEFWAISGRERVASASATFTYQNYNQVMTVTVQGDKLDGFQLRRDQYGILRVRWVLVEDEAGIGWGSPLNVRRLGLPVTAPGYLVPHGHSPDQGAGAEDWLEAADRMSPTGNAANLPVPLSQRFGPPTFTKTRDLMRRALSRQFMTAGTGATSDPSVALEPIALTEIAAIDPDCARLFGLAFVDRAASVGMRYDYRISGYWAGPLRFEWVCAQVPTMNMGPEGGPERTIGGGVTVRVASVRARRGALEWASGARLAMMDPLASAPTLAAIPGYSIRGEPAALTVEPAVGIGPSVATTPTGPSAPSTPGTLSTPPRMSTLSLTLPEPTDRVRVIGSSGGPGPLTVLAVSGTQIAGGQSLQGGVTYDVTLDATGITSVVVTGNGPMVTTTCRWMPVRQVIEETWIAFDVQRAPVPTLPAPGPLEARVLPSVARQGRPEQLVGLVIEKPPPVPGPHDPFPFARLAVDALSYDIERRTDGATPIVGTGGPWIEITRDATSGQTQPLLRSTAQPAAYRPPDGWPLNPPDYLDDTIDGNIRYYSYRARGRDIFGRLSGWSAPLFVDAADRIPPPAPAALSAHYLDARDPYLPPDDAASLATTAGYAVRARWSWTRRSWQQAPDVARFRVYWNSYPFSSVAGQVSAVASVSAGYSLQVSLTGLATAPVADAFAGDWLRQGNCQYRVLSSSASNPATIVVSSRDMPVPAVGPCAISLRSPDPQRLDFLGSPLRQDEGSPLVWEQRVLQGPVVRASGAVTQRGAGLAVTIAQVMANDPRPGLTTLMLTQDWRWSGEFPEPWELVVGATTYPVRAGQLGRTARLVVDLATLPIPAPGAAVLRDVAGRVNTFRVATAVPSAVPFVIVSGSVWTGQEDLAVLAHRAVGTATELALAVPTSTSPAAIAQLDWYPEHEAFVANLPLAVSAPQPHAAGVVGVSAVDDRAHVADRRMRAGEPTAPGNEGPVASATVHREYRGAPTGQLAPSGTAGTSELWTTIPDGFSGLSRFEVRWAAGGAHAFVALRATLDAVLDADQEDRAAGRGAYAGMGTLAGTALAQHRAQQSRLSAQSLQQLATAHDRAFAPITPEPLLSSDPLFQDSQQSGWLRYEAPLDGSAPGRHFLRLQPVDEAGNRGPLGPATLPIRVPDARRPLAPRLPRVIADDRALWVVWDAPDPSVDQYRVYRSQLASGTTPDVRDMAQIATVLPGQCPEPIAVANTSVRLPGDAPSSLVAVYLASEYDVSRPPTAQTATPLAGSFALNGNTVGGLVRITDGTFVFCVVRYTPTGPPTLAASSTSRAYRDTAVTPWRPHQYRMRSLRRAQVGVGAFLDVLSLPSDVQEGTPYDARPPIPPIASAVWNAAQSIVRVSWSPAGLPVDLDLLLQRDGDGLGVWTSVGSWSPASRGSIDDSSALSGHSYLYRLRARSASRSTSENEPVMGPLAIP